MPHLQLAADLGTRDAGAMEACAKVSESNKEKQCVAGSGSLSGPEGPMCEAILQWRPQDVGDVKAMRCPSRKAAGAEWSCLGSGGWGRGWGCMSAANNRWPGH